MSRYKLGLRIYRTIQCLVAIGFLVALILGWCWVTNPNEFPIKVVKIEATYQHLDKKKLQEKISPFVSHGFFGLRSRQLKEKLLEAPWVAKVDLQRIWPATVVIKVTEEKAIAKWRDSALVNAQGRIFKPPLDTFPVGVPHLIASDDQVGLMLKNYQAVNAILSPLSLYVTEMSMDDRLALSIVLNNGAQMLLGRTDPLLRLQRFVKVCPKIFTSNAQAKKIDLRYQNGLAIEWKQNYDDLHNE